MISRDIIKEQLNHTLTGIDLSHLGQKIEGKVRDCYVQGDRRILIASDRLSAFDKVLTTIPFKGQVLTQMAVHWFKLTSHIVPNHLLSHPHPNVMVTKEVEIIPVEVIVRGYLTGSAWRDYQANRPVSGISLPRGLKKSQKFSTPLITPSTKAEHGQHDLPISSEEVVSSGLVDKSIWQEVCKRALALYNFGLEQAQKNGLILVDTKYEFGLLKNSSGTKEIVLADEVHTPDSSRYWILDTYEQSFAENKDPMMLDKEFVRSWLIEQGYMGEGTPPTFTNDFRVDTAIRYIQAFEKVTGTEFVAEPGSVEEQIRKVL